MRSEHRIRCLAYLTILAAAHAVASGRGGTGFAVSPAVALPALVRVQTNDASGETWRQSGEIGGTVVVAGGEFRMALVAAGWRLDKTIVLGRHTSRSELMLWVRQKRRILFMVWEKEAGMCGFAWGEEQ